ncbi:hypothetical protein [Haloarcula sp. Atlit-7R]|uniref:hypothetical protein n=1 Tax=Haloarcula sp. Atlit-7R TaxID=2282125 RepID=UPI000EF139C8|nr:hypothetical protein [Haloarcula sp. Atlit-7R]RLM94335.1 hypothetical protein D3D01_15855 [Haloarcula sp. Atlit-7R]
MNLSTIDSLDKPDKITFLGWQTSFETADIAVGLGLPLMVFLFLTINDVSVMFTAPIVLFVATCSLTLIFAAPSYLNVSEYLSTLRFYFKRKGVVDNTSTESVPDDIEDGLLREFKADETTREMTQIKRFYPNAHVVERTDGNYLAALRIEAPNRDFDSADDFASLAMDIGEQANKNVDFYFQFYVTTRPFPIEDYISELEARLDDEDIQTKPIMEAILKEKIERRPEDLKQRGTEIPHYYLICKVSPRDINIEKSGTKSPIERMVDIPVIGFFFEILTNIRSEVEDHQREVRMLQQVRRKVSKLDNACVQSHGEFESRPVSSAEYSEIMHSFWTGENRASPEIRQQGAVTGVTDIPEVKEHLKSRTSDGDAEEQKTEAVTEVEQPEDWTGTSGSDDPNYGNGGSSDSNGDPSQEEGANAPISEDPLEFNHEDNHTNGDDE